MSKKKVKTPYQRIRKFIHDATEVTASKLGFPQLTPRQATTVTTGMFQEVITDGDRTEMFKRNQLAHAIVADVASDALTNFEIVKPDGEEFSEVNDEFQTLYMEKIAISLLRTLTYMRIHGQAGLLIGFSDEKSFSSPVQRGTKIDYLQALPKDLVKEIVLNKNPKTQEVILPLTLNYYELKSGEKIDASRIIHIHTFSLGETSLNGLSCLDPIYDLLTVIKSMDWGVGQTMWRQGAGLTTFTAPEGASSTHLDAIDSAVADINAKSVITVPSGTEVKTHHAAGLPPEGFYTVVCNQIAAGSRIPISILLGSQRGTISASEKDRKDYFELLKSIQINYITPTLIKIINLFQASEQLPEGEFSIQFREPSVVSLEESRATLNLVEAQHKKALALLHTANAKLISLRTEREYENYEQEQEQEDVKADSVAKASEMEFDYPGLLVSHLHAKLIRDSIQKALIKPVKLTSYINQPLFLISDSSLCYGIVSLTPPGKEITLKELKELTPMHLISEEERLRLFSDNQKSFYYYPIQLLTIFEKARLCSVPPDAQNFVPSVEFL